MSSKFRVVLVGNYPHDNQESMQRFGMLMFNELHERGVAVEVLSPKPVLGRLWKGAGGLGKWLGYLDKFVLFPRSLSRAVRMGGRADSTVVHICDHSNSAYVNTVSEVAHVITVHDLLAIRSAHGEFPENPTRWSGRVLQSMILSGLRKCQFAACDSEATRDDFLRFTGRSRKDTAKVLLGLNYPYAPMEATAASAVLEKLFAAQGRMWPMDFLLHVGGNQWYKNRPGVLRAFRSFLDMTPESGLTLVMAGAEPTGQLRCLVKDLGIEDRVCWTGRVSNEELRALYSRAEALIFPSLAEGFGWPPLEAQACGCPVITSNRAPMTEMVGRAALFVDPTAAADGAAAISQIVRMSRAEREAVREENLENVKRFSVDQMVTGYTAIYEELLGLRI